MEVNYPEVIFHYTKNFETRVNLSKKDWEKYIYVAPDNKTKFNFFEFSRKIILWGVNSRKSNLLLLCFRTIKELILHKLPFSEVRLTL